MIDVNTVLHTCGDGYWSREARAVTIIGLNMGYEADDGKFGELCVYFDTASWNVDELGLIYTDSQFEAELCEWLASIGFNASKVGYSEQGMQGIDYVSCDVGEEFIASWHAKSHVAA
jgi:hypothetical protein